MSNPYGPGGSYSSSLSYSPYDPDYARSASTLTAQAVYADSLRAEFDASVAAQQSIYTPEAAATASTSKATLAANRGRARKTVIRKGGGETWEDPTLLEWDPSHFRLFVGDLGNDVSDEGLTAAFGGYKSFVKAKVIRDKMTTKSRGFGFVSYADPEDFMKAWKDMDGKYVGSRPVKISKATTQVGSVHIGERKARQLEKALENKRGVGRHRGMGIMPSHAHKPYVRR